MHVLRHAASAKGRFGLGVGEFRNYTPQHVDSHSGSG
ncbi:hypothetical protein DP49_4931 [Burkholderia pseudomallei]|nr:hypothetical protein DO70_4300 [Burkholderia pseudomallei]KGD57543.1 hypothetical protein DP49_4931 [Burkholderia pseudomallei]